VVVHDVYISTRWGSRNKTAPRGESAAEGQRNTAVDK